MTTELVCSHCGWRWGWHPDWCPDHGKPATLDLASLVTRQRSEIDLLRARVEELEDWVKATFGDWV